jgi:alpha-glucosidase
MNRNKDWWKGAVIYQIYPRSFLDTNKDGIGDLPGITDRLDYIASLGVDGIWICPFYPSPMKDFGYDVSDYRGVDPMFGTLADFDALVKKAHALGLKVIIDLVLSHTSDRHPWFQDPEKKDWYIWADKPNNWVSVFGGSAWEYDERYGQYYLHNFLKEQPDLNFHNPDVQDELLDTARFWLERGADGFRLDTVNFYFHDQELRDNPERPPEMGAATQLEKDVPYSRQAHIYDKSRPENLVFISRLRDLLDEYNAFSVGELGDDHPFERAAEYTGDGLLHTTYNMQMMTGRHKPLTPALIREPLQSNQSRWPSWAFSNHDVVRAASRWCAEGNGFGHSPALSKMLIALLGCLNGTAFLYQGEELGLPEAKLDFDDLQDPWAKETWPEWQGRDGCRTPMPWQTTTPQDQWLPIPDEHLSMSVETQDQEQDSVLNFTRGFLSWRKTQAPLIHGVLKFDDANETTLAFTRTFDGVSIRCEFNLETYDFKIEGWR